MSKKIEITCFLCGLKKEIELKEYNRRLREGATRFFCSGRCAVIVGNTEKSGGEIVNGIPLPLVFNVMTHCEYCYQEFMTELSIKNYRRFCSPSCASKGSYILTDARKEGSRRGGKNGPHTADQCAKTLKHREAWKYEKVKEKLESENIPYEFEKVIGGRIFDLVLTDAMVCVEFDGPDHKYSIQKEIDDLKDTVADREGYEVIRVSVERNAIINPDLVDI